HARRVGLNRRRGSARGEREHEEPGERDAGDQERRTDQPPAPIARKLQRVHPAPTAVPAFASAALRSWPPVGPSPSALRLPSPWPGPVMSRRYASSWNVSLCSLVWHDVHRSAAGALAIASGFSSPPLA